VGTSDALSGAYTSAKFAISAAPDADTMMKLTDFTANFGGVQTNHSKIDFFLRFYGTDDTTPMFTNPVFNTDEEGWFTLEYLAGDSFDVSGFDSTIPTISDFSKVKKIQFKIYMETDNYLNEASNPFVQDIFLEYEIDTAAVVGTINFESGNARSVARGGSAEFGVNVNITGGYDSQIDSVVLRGEADDVSITIDPITIAVSDGITSYPTNVTFETTNLTPVGAHNISISAEVTGHSEMTFAPTLLTGILTVTDATSENFSLTWAGGADSDKTVQPGGPASYNFIITWDPSYTYAIGLTTNAMTVIGSTAVEKTEFFVDGAPAPVTQATRPSGSAPYTRAVEMRLTTKDSSGEKALTSFNITGTSTSVPPLVKNISAAPSLTISNQPANIVTINAKAEVEGGTAASFAAPQFTVRLYKKGASSTTYTEKTGVLAVSKDATTGKYVIRASFDKSTTDTNGKVVAGTTYIGYLRSTRHFWKKATTPTSGEITITAGTNSYTLEFPKMFAGDISPATPDNEINSLDFGAAIINFSQNLTNALNDFNNDGQVNTLDLLFIFANYFKKGDLLP
jgi:hypothetical protein